ncbi:MAG TPA: shikimate dehydrogenase [Clostridia bacterium]|nr:shikimate dehydrogenase [Clostridia bacterium]
MTTPYGLIGENLGHSISPRIHEGIFGQIGVPGTYSLFEVDKKYLQNVVPGLKTLGIKGANVTIPYKTDIIKFLDEISPEAKKIGAVNTIALEGNVAAGYNTDYFGFGMALDKYSVDTKGKTAVVLGTGGSSRAISQYLLDAGIGEIILVSRDAGGAGCGRYRDFRIITYSKLRHFTQGDILINCTPVGMHPHPESIPVPKASLRRFPIVFDLIYNPVETLLLKSARELGARAINGLYMLVAQAVEAQKLWHKMNVGEDLIDVIYREITT